MPPTIAESLKQIPLPSLDKELLLASVLKRERAFLLTHPEYELTLTQVRCFQKLVKRREQHEPLAYILGEKEFFRLSFLVNRFTLIPRPETELMVEEALKMLRSKKSKKKIAVIDVGTGSGCIIISLVKNLPSSIVNHQSSISFFATDISPEALTTARKNAAHHGVASSITFLQSDLLQSIQPTLQNFDELFILANLPYLSEALYANTEPDVQNFEPKTALRSGADGLNHYRRLLTELHVLAKTKKVSFLLEISPEQAPLMATLSQDTGAIFEEILPDLAGKSRIVKGSF